MTANGNERALAPGRLAGSETDHPSERRQLERLLEASSAIAFGISPDPDHSITWLRGDPARVLGYTDDEFRASGFWLERMHPDDREDLLRGFAAAPDRGTATHACRVRHRDGGFRWMDGRVWMDAAEGDAPRDISVHWVDVTANRTHEEDLLRAKRAADQANRAKSEFLANMSHEIRTPMNGVIGMTDLALETNLTDQQREYLQMVRNSAGALLDTINSILDFSKIEAGKMELEAIDFTLWETVTGALKPLALTARAKRVELLYDEGVGVPERVRGDPGRLRQALINLVGNAVKFTHSGTIRLSLTREPNEPRADDDAVTLRFEISDTGIGIPSDKIDRVFESFQQVDGSTTRRFGGTGLGLAITAGLVRLMDGDLTVASQPGVGSAFTFTARLRSARDPGAPRRPEGTLAGLRALVVDDHEANRTILASFVQRLDVEVSPATAGAEALDLLDAAYRSGTPIDVVLLDCHMPEMDGFELAARIRADPRFRDLVMVAITAAGRPGDGARCQELGIASYLLKPLAPWELRDALLLSLARDPAWVAPGQLVTRHSLREARKALHVLVAEDNHVNQQLAIHTLLRFGHTVRVARTGHEALEALEAERFDAVLMDIQMPEMDGVAATREVRRREAAAGGDRHIPIIAMTAHAMVGDRERFLAAGMDDYVSKPISKDRLREVLRGLRGQDAGGPMEQDDVAGATSGAARDGQPETPDRSPESRSAGPTYDRAMIMERMESDLDLIRTVISVFEVDGPKQLEQIEEALCRDDAIILERAAHTLKGAVAIFGAERARERAELLETLGRDGSIAEARGEYGPLRDAVSTLVRDLGALLQELDSGPSGT